MIRILLRYENGEYEIHDLPTSDLLYNMDYVLKCKIEETFNTKEYVYKDLPGTKNVSVVKLDDQKSLRESKLLFFKKISSDAKEHFKKLYPQFENQIGIKLKYMTIPGPLNNRDIDQIKKIFENDF